MALKVGLQLYSVRDEMEKSVEQTLKAVKEMGYDYVEFAGYFGYSAEAMRQLLDDLGLRALSVHQAHGLFLEQGQAAVDYIKTLGVSYCAVPGVAPERFKDQEAFAALAEEIRKIGELMAQNDITLLYHNHDFEFNKHGDMYWLDRLYETVPQELLQTELDVCWIRYAGEDPCAYIKKYTGRAPIVHLKDFICQKSIDGPVDASRSRKEYGFAFRPVGAGVQDFPAIIRAAEAAGADYVIVEQDASPDLPTLEAARQSRAYLKSLGI